MPSLYHTKAILYTISSMTPLDLKNIKTSPELQKHK